MIPTAARLKNDIKEAIQYNLCEIVKFAMNHPEYEISISNRPDYRYIHSKSTGTIDFTDMDLDALIVVEDFLERLIDGKEHPGA